jgi:hypothetical protein
MIKPAINGTRVLKIAATIIDEDRPLSIYWIAIYMQVASTIGRSPQILNIAAKKQTTIHKEIGTEDVPPVVNIIVAAVADSNK